MSGRDGRYYATERAVFRASLETDKGIQMGFLVCVCEPGIDGAAEEIAAALNAAEDKRRTDALIVAVIEAQEA